MQGNFGVSSFLRSWKNFFLSPDLSKCNFILNFDFLLFYISLEWLNNQQNLDFKTNLTYKPVKNPRYNVPAVLTLCNVSKLMPTGHTSMISKFQWGEFRELKSKIFFRKSMPPWRSFRKSVSQPSSAPASSDLSLLNTFLWYRFCFVLFI